MLFEPLFAHASQKPQDTAIIDDHGRYTFQQLAAMSAGLGMYLPAQTMQPRVGLLLPSGAGFVASFYGTLLAGKGVVPINFLLGDKEIGHCIADSGIDTIVSIPLLAGHVLEVLYTRSVDSGDRMDTWPSILSPESVRLSSDAERNLALIRISATSTCRHNNLLWVDQRGTAKRCHASGMPLS